MRSLRHLGAAARSAANAGISHFKRLKQNGTDSTFKNGQVLYFSASVCNYDKLTFRAQLE
jgi:hypothetical protein